MKRIFSPRILGMAASAWLLAVSGCDRDSVKVYHVETNDMAVPALPPASAPAQASTPAPDTTMPATMPAGLPAPDNSGLPPLKYTLPDGWKEKELTQMRVASFGVADNGQQADISVIPLGGMAGGDFANVNRWRGQVGLGPVADDDLQKLAEKVVVAGQPADLYDVTGTSSESGVAERIVGVILHRDDTAWFFKMTGEPALVEAQKPLFVAFLKSIEFGEPAAPATMDLSSLPPSHPAIDAMTPGASAQPAGTQPAWDVPAGWQAGPLEQFLVAKYIIAGAGGTEAEVNVSSLDGSGGGLAPNVNRWRAQLGLAPATDDDVAKLATIDASGAKAAVLDVSGVNPSTGKPAELVGVVLPLGGQTWFYKLMGDADVVTQQKDAFLKFIQSAKYPNAP